MVLQPPPVTTVTVTIDSSKDLFSAEPTLAEVPATGLLVWTFRGLPAGHRPTIDFVGFQAEGAIAIESDFEEPNGELRFTGRALGATSSAVQMLFGVPGDYWYKISLIPGRGAGERVIRLDCEPAAGIKIPPARPDG